MFVSTQNLVTGHFTRLQVVSDAIFDTLTMPHTVDHASAAALKADTGGTNAIRFPEGTVINGYITAVKLVSGAIILE